MDKYVRLLIVLLAFKFGKTSIPNDYSYDEYPDLADVDEYNYYDNLYNENLFLTFENLTNLDQVIKTFGNGKSLEIKNSNLSSHQFSELPVQLKRLKILNTTIQDLNENTFEGFSSLELLALEGIKINSINGKMFSSLKSLTTLNLNHNKLTQLSNGIFDNLKLLKTLHLSHNNLSVIENGVFNQLMVLQEIYLSHNRLGNVDSLFSSLNSLKVLDLRANYISKIPTFNTNITMLFLGENQLKTLDNIDKLNKLTHLDVSQNYLETFDVIGALYNMEVLNLSSNNIEVLNKSIISNLTTLINLDISHNSIETIEIGTFQNSKYLHSLNISHNLLKRITYGMIPKNIHGLNLSFNKIKIFRENFNFNNLYFIAIELEGNYLKCKDLIEYKNIIRGNSFDTENINGVDCLEEDNEDIISDKTFEILEKKLNGSILYTLLNGNFALPTTNNDDKIKEVDSQNFKELEEQILKIIQNNELPTQQVENYSCATSVANLILTSTIMVVLCVIILLLYFKSSYRRLRNTFEFSEN